MNNRKTSKILAGTLLVTFFAQTALAAPKPRGRFIASEEDVVSTGGDAIETQLEMHAGYMDQFLAKLSEAKGKISPETGRMIYEVSEIGGYGTALTAAGGAVFALVKSWEVRKHKKLGVYQSALDNIKNLRDTHVSIENEIKVLEAQIIGLNKSGRDGVKAIAENLEKQKDIQQKKLTLQPELDKAQAEYSQEVERAQTYKKDPRLVSLRDKIRGLKVKRDGLLKQIDSGQQKGSELDALVKEIQTLYNEQGRLLKELEPKKDSLKNASDRLVDAQVKMQELQVELAKLKTAGEVLAADVKGYEGMASKLANEALAKRTDANKTETAAKKAQAARPAILKEVADRMGISETEVLSKIEKRSLQAATTSRNRVMGGTAALLVATAGFMALNKLFEGDKTIEISEEEREGLMLAAAAVRLQIAAAEAAASK